MPVLDVVFDQGVFRPVKPVVLPDRCPLTISFEVPSVHTKPVSPTPPLLPTDESAVIKLPAAVYPDADDYPDLGEDTYVYQPVPPKDVKTYTVRLIDLGPIPPARYYDEE